MIENGISKQVCLRKFPQLSSIARVVEEGCRMNESSVDGSSDSDVETLRRDHRVYASLLQALETLVSSPTDCIEYAIGASSTDNYPVESITNTLYPRERYLNRASYWSSKGQRNPEVPETLIYRLKADFAVVTEIEIQPFEGIYSFFEASPFFLFLATVYSKISFDCKLKFLFSLFSARQTHILSKVCTISNGSPQIFKRNGLFGRTHTPTS